MHLGEVREHGFALVLTGQGRRSGIPARRAAHDVGVLVDNFREDPF